VVLPDRRPGRARLRTLARADRHRHHRHLLSFRGELLGVKRQIVRGQRRAATAGSFTVTTFGLTR